MYFNTVVTDILQTAFRLDLGQFIMFGYGRQRERTVSILCPARVDSRPGGPTLPGVPRGAPVKELRDPPIDTAGTL
jgi:hypothetical protein